MKRFILPTVALSVFCFTQAAASPEEQPNAAPTPAAVVNEEQPQQNTGGKWTDNPWDKYAPAPAEKTEPEDTEKAKPANSGQANPWDKYAPAPTEVNTETEAPDALDNEPDMPAPEAGSTDGANPWDKYAPAPSGTTTESKNPWDKYAPAQGPEPTKAEPSQKDEKPLELAKPLKKRPVPEGKLMVKNALPMGKDNFFAIKYEGNVIGYNRFKVESLTTLGGKSTYILNSDSRIKVGMNGIQDLKYSSELQLNKVDLAPSLLRCTQKTGSNAFSLDCLYSANLIAQRNMIGDDVDTHVENLTGPIPHLIFNNLWGQMDIFAEHYWLAVRSAASGGTLDVYDPILQTFGKIIVYTPVQEKQNGKNTLLYTISDMRGCPLAEVRLTSNYELMEVNEIGSGISFVRSTPDIISKADKSKGADLWTRRTADSNIYFPDPKQLSNLEADIELRMRGGDLAQHEIPGFKQAFYGELKEGYMKGRIDVSSSLPQVSRKTAFPFSETVPEEFQAYTQPGAGIESADTTVINKAKEIAWKSESSFLAARRLTGFIFSQIETGASMPSAALTLHNKVGNSESKALLLTAMARALGMPARPITGVIYHEGSFMPHNWSEIWLGEEGWTPFDPTTNESGFINAGHIAVGEAGEIQSISANITKFAPHPPRKVNFFNSPLNWSVGEKRVYSIYKDGKRLGTETAHMYDMEVLDEQEVFKLKSETVLGGPQPADAKSSGSEDASDESSETPSPSEVKLGEALSDASSQTSDKNAGDAENSGNTSAENSSDTSAEASGEASAENSGDASAESQETPQEPLMPLQTLSCDTTLDTFGLPIHAAVIDSDGRKTVLDFQKGFITETSIADEKEKTRKIPYSRGTYLADQRFLSLWALIAEQIPNEDNAKDKVPATQDAAKNKATDTSDTAKETDQSKQSTDTTQSFHVFIPDLLNTQELILEESEEDETVTMPDGTEVETTKLSTEKGMDFYVNDKHQIIKIAIPNQQIEVFLDSIEFSIE